MTSRRLAIVFGLVVLLVLGGCTLPGTPTGDDPADGTAHSSDDLEPEPTALFEATFVHAEDLDNVHGEQTTEVTDGTNTIVETVAVSERPYVEYRSEVLDASIADRVGDVYISNASGSWWYDAAANEAGSYEAAEPYDNEVVREARADEAERQLELYDLEYRGTETIADRETHRLAVEPKDEVVADGISLLVGDTEYVYALETVDPSDELEVLEQRIWIDAAYDYPLKEELVFEGPDGDRHTMVERFDEVTFNADLDDETFTFDPPEDNGDE
ncbi:LolA family protein [Natrialbaceae archaeon A-arb3/5]